MGSNTQLIEEMEAQRAEMASPGSHTEATTEPGHGPIYKTLTHALPAVLTFWGGRTWVRP